MNDIIYGHLSKIGKAMSSTQYKKFIQPLYFSKEAYKHIFIKVISVPLGRFLFYFII